MNTLFILTIFVTICVSLSKPSHHHGDHGFSVDLIHMDSPLSPLYNPTLSQIDRNQNVFRRSISRALRMAKSQSKVYADISGEYIMKIGIGTPPVQVYGSVGTTFGLIWAPCEPCKTCYKQAGARFFVPASSSTYHADSCRSRACKSLPTIQPRCGTENNNCRYQNSDTDSYYTEGVLARDTFSIGPTPYKQVLFGCAHYYEDLQYFTPNVSGRIGLGRGPLSLVSQLKPAIQGKFSYCLMPCGSSKPSKIYFGEHVNMSGPNVVSTPLKRNDYSTLYSVHLTDLLVGNKSILSQNHNHTRYQSDNEKGNMVIDIDMAMTFLPKDLYDPFIASMTKAIRAKPIHIPRQFTDYDICYKDLSLDSVPNLTLRFTGGANVEVPPTNMFMELQKGMTCLAIISTSNTEGILGNLFQTNLMVGFDLIKQKVYFKPTDCAIR
ncbi:aspartic proteinase CDR1-like [Bidens hawaiensis]|uniref:aspartic proteinase CDR1-like n=1 Tax=Bidens hawaiensis TaxID=980011 RepID=UPI00404B3A81